MTTRLDRIQEAKNLAALRRMNVAELEDDIKEAKAILLVLPTGGFKEQKDRQELEAHIDHIYSVLDDERNALIELETIINSYGEDRDKTAEYAVGNM